MGLMILLDRVADRLDEEGRHYEAEAVWFAARHMPEKAKRLPAGDVLQANSFGRPGRARFATDTLSNAKRHKQRAGADVQPLNAEPYALQLYDSECVSLQHSPLSLCSLAYLMWMDDSNIFQCHFPTRAQAVVVINDILCWVHQHRPVRHPEHHYAEARDNQATVSNRVVKKSNVASCPSLRIDM